MAKTYTAVPNVSTLQTYASADYNTYTATNISNLIVPPACRATRTTTQSIGNASATNMLFPTEDFDTDGMHDTSTSTDRITINTAGIYVFTATVVFDISATGVRELYISHSSAGRLAQMLVPTAGGSFFTELSVSATYSCNVGEYVVAPVFQNSGGALNTRGDYGTCSLTATWIGRTS